MTVKIAVAVLLLAALAGDFAVVRVVKRISPEQGQLVQVCDPTVLAHLKSLTRPMTS